MFAGISEYPIDNIFIFVPTFVASLAGFSFHAYVKLFLCRYWRTLISAGSQRCVSHAINGYFFCIPSSSIMSLIFCTHTMRIGPVFRDWSLLKFPPLVFQHVSPIHSIVAAILRRHTLLRGRLVFYIPYGGNRVYISLVTSANGYPSCNGEQGF